MTEQEIEAAVRQVLTRVVPEIADRPIDREAIFRDQFDIDSMDFLNFVVGLHETIGIDVPEDDYPQLASLAGCIRYLQERIGSRQRNPSPPAGAQRTTSTEQGE